LVKLVIDEPESAAVERHLGQGQLVATSRIALVEVPRATAIANASADVGRETQRLLGSCLLVDVTDALLRAAAELASASLGTLDAIHLASALRIEPDELVAYDRRLTTAAAGRGLVVSSPRG
jgi:predicted nucleic acid-binding protein